MPEGREKMKKNITKMKLGERLKQDRTDWELLNSMRDEDIDCSDIPELDAETRFRAQALRGDSKRGLELLDKIGVN